VTSNTFEIRVRLVGVDAPETSKGKNKPGQPFSQQSKQYLAKLVLNKTVEIKSYGHDRYNRVLGVIFVDGKNVNLELVKAGVSFRELSQQSWMPPDEFIKRRYPVMAHGIGMADEWPAIPWPIDFEAEGYDGVLEENQAICIESYIGSEHGGEGVKLEEQIVVTRDGYQQMSTFPYETDLLA